MRERQKVQLAELDAAPRRREALELRAAGNSYEQIAEVMGISPMAVAGHVNAALRRAWEIDHERTEEIRQLEIERLDGLWKVFWPRATDKEKPSLAAAGFCLKLAKRRAELLGLDREVRVTIDARQIHVTSEQIAKVAAMANDPNAAVTLERLASIYAHGDAAFEDAEWEEVASTQPTGQNPETNGQ
jgi:DNA-binding transcriptional ArsR family regulator